MTHPSSEIELLAAAIKKSGTLSNYEASTGGEPIEHATAYAVLEILGSTSRLVNDIYPKMRHADNPEIIDDLLHQFREEIRHIYYHIQDSKFLSAVIGSIG